MNKIDLKYLKQFELFNNQNEMDSSTWKVVDYLHEQGVQQSVVDVLLCLGASSLRVLGISFKKQATIAKEVGYSRVTVNKALGLLEKWNVIDSVQSKTAAGRPSVKVYRIKPFNLSSLQQAFTSSQAYEANGDKGMTLISDFEPFEPEARKQESNNYKGSQSMLGKISKLSTTIDLDGDLKNIVRYLALKVADSVKNGVQIEAFSSYCGKVLANEMRRASVMQKIADEKRQKEEAKRRHFEDFVLRLFGDRFEGLGAFAKEEAVRMYNEATQSVRPKPVFYNWLEV